MNLLFLCVFLIVADCKKLYKSVRDSVRYKQKKIAGKSGDSGDDTLTDEPTANSSGELSSFAFLLPTASKFPRKTSTLGGAAATVQKDDASAMQRPV